ncbi:MAG: MFS transporter [Candidatus Sulfomarinibacteraceae bacterium]
MSDSPAVVLSRWRGYSWLVAVLALVIVSTSNGMITSGLTVFDESLLEELGCSVSQLKTRDSITFLVGSLLVVGAGWLADRFGFKPLLLVGMALLGGGFLLYSQAQTLVQLYLLHFVFAAVIALAGNTISIVTAATWMPMRQGLAVGITVAGSSVGGMLIPPLLTALNTRFGWRTTMRMESLWPLVLLCVIALVLRNRPKRGIADDETCRATGADEGVPFRQVLRSPQYYQVWLAGALTYFAVLALFSHLFLYLRSLDHDPVRASLGLSIFGLSSLLGKLASGWLSDRASPYVLLRVQMFAMLAGLVGITLAPDFVWVFLGLTGLGWGSLHTLYNVILLTLFGLRDAGKINGSLSLGGGAGGGLGIYLTGIIHDAAGGYFAAFGMVCGVMLLGTLLTLRLRPPGHGARASV